jgi:hypothetical protein
MEIPLRNLTFMLMRRNKWDQKNSSYSIISNAPEGVIMRTLN